MNIKTCLHYSVAFFFLSCGNVQEKKDAPKTNDPITESSATAEAAPLPAVAPYLNELTYGKIKFNITSPQSVTANQFTIKPSVFTMSNDTMTLDCEGVITQSEVGDMDGDNAPELLVVTQSGPDKKGKAYVFSANGDKSLSMVNLPDHSQDPQISKGYAGYDEFALIENSLSLRFPLYENDKPINKTRQLQYKLKAGEAMKQLVLNKTLEY